MVRPLPGPKRSIKPPTASNSNILPQTFTVSQYQASITQKPFIKPYKLLLNQLLKLLITITIVTFFIVEVRELCVQIANNQQKSLNIENKSSNNSEKNLINNNL